MNAADFFALTDFSVEEQITDDMTNRVANALEYLKQEGVITDDDSLSFRCWVEDRGGSALIAEFLIEGAMEIQFEVGPYSWWDRNEQNVVSLSGASKTLQ